MYNFNLYNLIYFFAFYSFAGWCLEILYYFKVEHRFVNRGFLYGPFCPIYGFGVLFLITFLNDYRNHIFVLFFLATFFTSVLEYITGYVLEKTFKTKWWDYTEDPLNLHGRVCLPYSLLWGVGEIAIIKIVHPVINRVVDDIPKPSGDILILVILLYFIIDFCFTLISLIDFEKISYGFQFAPVNFLLDKPSMIFSSTKEKAIDKMRAFESIFNRFKFNFNNKYLRRNLSSNKQLTSIFKSLKDKLKKD
jgi:uncharacterized membrane protein